jgi:putative oxidoreductase
MAAAMTRAVALHDRAVAMVSSRFVEGAALLLTRLALAGIFWRSGRSKIEDGTWFTISKGTRYLFAEEYAAVPLPPDIAMVMATVAEHVLPALLLVGLATRLSALGLIGMTLVIQIFVFPEAWWPVHALWMAMALILVTRGAGLYSLDAVIGSRRKA